MPVTWNARVLGGAAALIAATLAGPAGAQTAGGSTGGASTGAATSNASASDGAANPAQAGAANPVQSGAPASGTTAAAPGSDAPPATDLDAGGSMDLAAGGSGALPAAAAGDAPTAASPTPSNATPLPAAYLVGGEQVPAVEIDQLVSNPGTLLVTYPVGNMGLTNYVRRLGASDSRSVAPLVQLAGEAGANDSQIASIGAGLARAAKGGQAVAPGYSAFIATEVAKSNNPRLIAAFQAALTEQAYAALGGSGPAGGGEGSAGFGSLGGGGQNGEVNGAPNEPIPVNTPNYASGTHGSFFAAVENVNDDNDGSKAD